MTNFLIIMKNLPQDEIKNQMSNSVNFVYKMTNRPNSIEEDKLHESQAGLGLT